MVQTDTVKNGTDRQKVGQAIRVKNGTDRKIKIWN